MGEAKAVVDQLRHHRTLDAQAAGLHGVFRLAEHVDDPAVLQMDFEAAQGVAELAGAVDDPVGLQGAGLVGEIEIRGLASAGRRILSLRVGQEVPGGEPEHGGGGGDSMQEATPGKSLFTVVVHVEPPVRRKQEEWMDSTIACDPGKAVRTRNPAETPRLAVYFVKKSAGRRNVGRRFEGEVRTPNGGRRSCHSPGSCSTSRISLASSCF